MPVKDRLKRAAAAAGYEIRRAHPPGPRRVALLEQYGVHTVIDVGANQGQYGERLRAAGFAGRIVSFEPQPAPLESLRARAESSAPWEVHQLAVGAESGTATMNVANGDDCSSLLPSSDEMRAALPEATPMGTIAVPVERLDAVLGGLRGPAMLKIDTQGFEHRVLDGAEGLLEEIVLLDVEMALSRNYVGGSSIYDLMPRMQVLGFQALWVEPGFTDPKSGQVLDVDVLLRRLT